MHNLTGIEHPDMLMQTMTPVIGEVRISDPLDRLVITPRRGTDRHALIAALRRALPGLKLKPSADGIQLAARDADALLDAEGVVDLQWKAEARRFAENRREAKRVHEQIHRETNRIVSGGRSL